MKTLRLWLAAGTVISTCAVALSVALRYSDHCLNTGDRLTEAQRIEIAIGAVLSSYPPEVISKKWVEHAGKRVLQELTIGESPRAYSLHQPDKPIGYSGIEDFQQKNIDCCSVVEMRSLEEGAPSRWSMLLGGEASYVRVTYRVPYLNERGASLEVRYQEYVGITSCGRSVRSAGKIL